MPDTCGSCFNVFCGCGHGNSSGPETDNWGQRAPGPSTGYEMQPPPRSSRAAGTVVSPTSSRETVWPGQIGSQNGPRAYTAAGQYPSLQSPYTAAPALVPDDVPAYMRTQHYRRPGGNGAADVQPSAGFSPTKVTAGSQGQDLPFQRRRPDSDGSDTLGQGPPGPDRRPRPDPDAPEETPEEWLMGHFPERSANRGSLTQGGEASTGMGRRDSVTVPKFLQRSG